MPTLQKAVSSAILLVAMAYLTQSQYGNAAFPLAAQVKPGVATPTAEKLEDIVSIRDDAGFFSAAAIDKATKEIKELTHRYQRPFIIETFKAIPADKLEKYKAIDAKDFKAKSDFFYNWAGERWKAISTRAIYVLICKDPSYVQATLSKETTQQAFTSFDRNDLASAVVKGLRDANTSTGEAEKQKGYDKTLLSAVSLVHGRLETNLNPPTLVIDAGGHTGGARGLCATPDGKLFMTAGLDGTVRVWDGATGEALRVLRPPTDLERAGSQGLAAIAVSPDGRTLAVPGWAPGVRGDVVRLIAVADGRTEGVIETHSNEVIRTLEYSPDGKLIATGNAGGTVAMWDVATRRLLWTVDGHQTNAYGLAFSPDGVSLASCSGDKTARIWNTRTGKAGAVLTGHTDVVRGIAWSPDGKTIATNGYDRSAILWGPDGTLKKRFDKFPGSMAVNFTRNSDRILVSGANTSTFVDIATGKRTPGFGGDISNISNCILLGTGDLAVNMGVSGHLWRTKDGTLVRNLNGLGREVQSVGWGSDSTTIAWGMSSHEKPKVNDLGPLGSAIQLTKLVVGPAEGELKRTGTAPPGLTVKLTQVRRNLTVVDGEKDVATWTVPTPDNLVESYAWLSKSEMVVGTRYGHYLIDPQTGKTTQRYPAQLAINAVAPSPDGRYFLTGSADQTVRVWTTKQSTPLLSVFVAGNEWVAWTQDGYYACSPGGERLIGWRISEGPDKLMSVHSAAQFRASLYRPDVIKRLLTEGSVDKALASADKDRGGRRTTRTDVAQVLPPKVAVTFPEKSGQKLATSKFEVKASASSVGDNPVTSLRLLVDGRPYGGEASLRTVRSAKVGDVKESWQVELPQGSHRVAILAKSAVSEGVSDEVEVFIAPTSETPKQAVTNLHLLAVGINAYPGRMRLDCAVPDAKGIDEAFRTYSKNVYRVNSTLLLDKEATRANILKGLSDLEKRAKPGDLVVVYYAGHGDCKVAGEFVMVSIDATVSKEKLAQTGVSGEEVKDRLAKLPCKVLLIMDCCYAGSFDAGSSRKKRALPNEAADLVRDSSTDDRGLVVMCGASKEQESGEESKLGHGYFTQSLIEGLSGKAARKRDGTVHLSGLHVYVEERVQELSNDEQFPTIGKPTLIRSFLLSKP